MVWMMDSAAVKRSLKEDGARGSAGPWGKRALFMSRFKRGSVSIVREGEEEWFVELVDLDENQPPSFAATLPGEDVWDCIVDLRRVRVGRRVKEEMAAVSILPYSRSISYSSGCASCSGDSDLAGDGRIPTLMGAEVPLNQESMTDLEVCRVLRLLAVSLVFDVDVIKLASDFVGDDAPEEQFELSQFEELDAEEVEFATLEINGSFPRNAFVI